MESDSREGHAGGPAEGLQVNDLFPEVAADPVIAARHRAFSRHQHAAVVDADNNERYTLQPTLDECMRFAGVDHIDIDLAACVEAHCADEWLGRQLDGTFLDALSCSWRPKWWRSGRRWGWLNPPYDALEAFTERLALAMIDGELDGLMYLPPGDRCEQPWWHKWFEPYRDGGGLLGGKVRVRTRPLPGRQKFGSPGDPGGLLASSAPFPSVLVVLERCA